MSSNSALALRMWRLRPWNLNPLMRGSDRCESLIRALLIAGLLLMVPVAGAIGSTTYTRTAEQIRAAAATKTEVSATAVTDATQLPAATLYRGPDYQATVRWVRDGVASTAAVDVDSKTKAGATVPIWVGANGNPTGAPDNPATAALDGIGIGLMVLLASGIVAVASMWGVELLLSGMRNQQWEAEWRRVGRPIGT